MDARGRPLSSILCGVPGAFEYRSAGESGESVCQLEDAAGLWYVWRAGFCGYAGGSGYTGAEGGVVSEVAGTFAFAAGGDGWIGALNQEWAGWQHSGQIEQRGSEFAGIAAEFCEVWDLAAVHGVSGRFAGTSCVSDGTWDGGRGVHHGAEVLL